MEREIMDEDERLRNITKWKYRPRAEKAVRLGETLKELMEKGIAPQHKRFGPLVEQWEQMLPEELGKHCKIVEFLDGRLRIHADSPSYRCELQLCSGEILKQLRSKCPQSRVREIMIVL